MSWKILATLNWIKESRLITGPTRLISSVWNSRPVCWISRGYNAFCCYHLVESALANSLVLNTYRHGTSFKNYFGIVLYGLDPKKGGDPNAGGEAGSMEAQGHDSPFANGDKGYVYLGADTDQPINAPQIGPLKPICWANRRFGTRLQFSALSNFAMLAPHIKSSSRGRYVALLLACFTPTIKAHFAPPEPPENYPPEVEVDLTMPDEAVRTRKHLGWNHLGISGSLWQGLKNPNLPKRIAKNPTRFSLGIAQAVLAVCATAKLFGRSVPLPVPNALHKLWDYRILRWPIEYGIRFSAW